jgi:outer membrane biosynthesis protein TonB
MKTLTHALRPWTIDFHVAQNDATVRGSGTHDKTGHHCLPNDPDGKLSIAHHAGYWLHGDDGKLTKAFRHICWDGCMFPNAVMMKQETWNDILGAMIAVRDAHGWREEKAKEEEVSISEPIQVKATTPKPAARKPAKAAPKKTKRPAAKKPAKKAAPKKPARKLRAKAAPKAKSRKSKAPKKAVSKAKKQARKKPAKRKR